jgi:CubicO group peptidase (beta-lactamase class C family)
MPRESEFPYWTGPDFVFPTREEIRAKIATQSALYPAGSYFQYSNLGLTLVGETVAAVSGKPYTDYVQANVLAPIGLNDTRTVMPMELYGKRLAVGYGALKRDGTRDLLKPFNARGLAPAAGYTSTVEEPRQVRLLAVPCSALRPDKRPEGFHIARDATRPVHGPRLEDQLGTWF